MKLSEMTVSDALGGKWGIRVFLVAAVIGIVVAMEYADKHTPIDHSLVANNRAVLAQCVDAKLCIDGFIRKRGASASFLNIKACGNNCDYSQVDVTQLVELTKRKDKEADYFFNKIDSIILQNERARWHDAFDAYWMGKNPY